MDRCITDNTFICQNRRLCLQDTDWWMVLSIQPGVYKEEWGGGSVWYERDMDGVMWSIWLGTCPPKRERERDSKSWVETDVAEEGLTGRSREGGLHRANGWIEWDDKEWSERQQDYCRGTCWIIWGSEERSGWVHRESYAALLKLLKLALFGRERKAAQMIFLWPWSCVV